MKWITNLITNFLVRMVIGIAIIIFINQFLVTKGIEKNVGVNPVTIITTGTFGVPGVCLLYGIVFYNGI